MKDTFLAVLAGGLAGSALAILSARHLETLLYLVKPTDIAMQMVPAFMIVASAFVAVLPAVIRAVRINLVALLRSE
jgi:hypothetical protein